MTALKKIYIEITNRCNLACPFCARSDRAKGTMAVTAFAEVLHRLAGATHYLCLHVLGEPLLHPHFDRLLALCQEQGFRVNLTTNGTLLARHRQTLLASPALRQINISLHGLAHLERRSAEAHLAGVLDFAQEASRTTGLYLSLRLWNLGAGGAQAKRVNPWLLQRLTSAFGHPPLRADALRSERGIPLAPRVFLNPEEPFTWPRPDDPDLGRLGHCRGLRDHLAILVDGTVVPCCLDAEGVLALGNIFAQSLDEVLASPRAVRMREGLGHQWLVEPLCRRCSYRLRFSVPAGS